VASEVIAALRHAASSFPTSASAYKRTERLCPSITESAVWAGLGAQACRIRARTGLSECEGGDHVTGGDALSHRFFSFGAVPAEDLPVIPLLDANTTWLRTKSRTWAPTSAMSSALTATSLTSGIVPPP
jgi:hypothetical protein